jgi:hypothetical protein
MKWAEKAAEYAVKNFKRKPQTKTGKEDRPGQELAEEVKHPK